MGIDKRQELLGMKLQNGILIPKKGNKTTPSPTWKLGFSDSSSVDSNFPMNTSVSARKIGANLWEVQPQFNFNIDSDDHGDNARLSHHHSRRHHIHQKQGFQLSDQLAEEPPDCHPHPPEAETSLRRNIRGLQSLSHLSVGKNGEDLQHVSSASCCSSMQVTPYICAITPTGYTLRTSTHLPKVLNRIWNLEEQHSSNMDLIEVLKRDLDISRAQIKTLLEERETGHREMNELQKSTHERMRKTVRSTRDELSDVLSSFMREKKARILLERLCDEFAKGIRDYEQKVRLLQQNREKKDQIMSKNESNRLILQVSEAWLDERMQPKCDFPEKTSISDNLCRQIETFLEAKKKLSCGSGSEDDHALEKHVEDISYGAITEPSKQLASTTSLSPGATEPSWQSMPRIGTWGPGGAEPSSKSMSRMTVRGLEEAEPSSQSMLRMIAQDPGVASRTNQGPGAAEPPSKPISRMTDRSPGVTEPSIRRDREVVKANTLMAKLLEARVESQFAKSRTLRR